MTSEGSSYLRKKKKSSLLVRARKYGRKGQYGRGHSIEEDTYNYFLRVLERLKDTFDGDEKSVFVSNVFTEVEGHELEYSCNQLVSRVLEALMPDCSDEIVIKYLNAFSEDLRLVCVDPYASHVLEKLLIVASRRSKNESDEFEVWVTKVARFLLNNLEEFTWHMYANHVIRTVLECLSGVRLDEKITHSRRATSKVDEGDSIEVRHVPSWQQIVGEFSSRIMSWPQFSEIVESDSSCGLIQALLYTLQKTDSSLCKKLVKHLRKKCFTVHSDSEEQNLLEWSPIFDNESAVRALEATLSVATPKEFKKLYDTCFCGRLLKFAEHPTANFALQKLLEIWSDSSEFASVFTELGDNLEDVLASGNTGVVLHLCKACQRLNVKQAGFIQCLMTAFHCWEPNERQKSFAPCLIYFIAYEMWHEKTSEKKYPVHLHGSLILQTLLEFNKPMKVISSILAVEPEQLMEIADSPRGSHIFDVFVKMEHGGEKNREKLVERLKGQYVGLSCSKHGSRVLEAIWSKATLKQKTVIAAELSAKEPLLAANVFGKYSVEKMALWLFKHRNGEWQEVQLRNTKKHKILEDILGEETVCTKRTKKSKH